jgi:[NiFe] hydrogenase diaphorase moiety large subunit
MRDIASLMQAASHCGLGHTAPAPVLDLLDYFPDVWQQRLAAGGFEPSFDIDAALSEAKQLTGRDYSGGRLGDDA